MGPPQALDPARFNETASPALTTVPSKGKWKGWRVVKRENNGCCSNLAILVTAYIVPTAISACSNGGVCTIHPVTQYVLVPAVVATTGFIGKKIIECFAARQK